tara:strand:+ start:323 stop:691 length:369 start_codon:yes stop_codon:yes gene_type:complete
MENNELGAHVTLDLKGCNKDKLKDVEFVIKLLNELPEKLGMTKITHPYVFPYSGLVPEDKGVTGFIVIAESHISIHTFQERDYVFVDVFSCKPFDADEVVNYFVDAFEARECEKNTIGRGFR